MKRYGVISMSNNAFCGIASFFKTLNVVTDMQTRGLKLSKSPQKSNIFLKTTGNVLRSGQFGPEMTLNVI